MFKHRFVCTDKENIQYKIEQLMINDIPCGKSFLGGSLYKDGIHFQECGEKIKGFYITESEDEWLKGSPIRVYFTGKFVENEGMLYFDVYIYPNEVELLFLIFTFVFLSVTGKIIGIIIAIIVLSLFAKGYYDMMNDTYHILKKILN